MTEINLPTIDVLYNNQNYNVTIVGNNQFSTSEASSLFSEKGISPTGLPNSDISLNNYINSTYLLDSFLIAYPDLPVYNISVGTSSSPNIVPPDGFINNVLLWGYQYYHDAFYVGQGYQDPAQQAISEANSIEGQWNIGLLRESYHYINLAVNGILDSINIVGDLENFFSPSDASQIASGISLIADSLFSGQNISASLASYWGSALGINNSNISGTELLSELKNNSSSISSIVNSFLIKALPSQPSSKSAQFLSNFVINIVNGEISPILGSLVQSYPAISAALQSAEGGALAATTDAVTSAATAAIAAAPVAVLGALAVCFAAGDAYLGQLASTIYQLTHVVAPVENFLNANEFSIDVNNSPILFGAQLFSDKIASIITSYLGNLKEVGIFDLPNSVTIALEGLQNILSEDINNMMTYYANEQSWIINNYSLKINTITASPNYGDITTGHSIAFTLDLNYPVTVSGGTPDLILNDGGTAVYDAAASGTSDLVFDYTVQSGQSTDGLAVSSLDLGGASIVGPGGSTDLSNAAQIFPSLAVNASTSLPVFVPPSITVTALTASPDTGNIVIGQSIALTLDLSAPVTVSGGTPDLILNDGGTATYDAAASGGSDMVFNYTVQSGQSTDALAVSSLDLNGASVVGTGGSADLANVGTSFPNLEVNVQTTATPLSIGGAGNTVTYTADGAAVAVDPKLSVSDTSATDLTGATIEISSGVLAGDRLNFVDQNGIVGQIFIFNGATDELTLSGTASLADYQAALDSVTYSSTASDPTANGSDTSRTFTWTVSDANGSSQPVTSTIDIQSAAQAGPTLVVMTVSPDAAGDFTTGESMTFTLRMSASVTVSGGTPDLILNDGGTATYDAAASGGSDMVFNYTVQSGQSTDALAVATLDLNGASIVGAGGSADFPNAPFLTIANLAVNAPQNINITWSNGTNGNWAASTDWNPAIIPGTTDNVIIDAGAVTINSEEFCGNLTLGSHATLTITQGAELWVNNSGTIDNAGVISLDQGSVLLANGNLTLTGGGSIELSGQNTTIVGNGTATLTNYNNTISGAGTIETPNFINGPEGVVEANGSGDALVLNPVNYSFSNNGEFVANNGLLKIEIPVIGSGGATIDTAGTIALLAKNAQNVSFNGTGGVLELGAPLAFSGVVNGFVSGDTIVLTQDAYASSDKVSLGAGNTLTVTGNNGTLADLTLNPNGIYATSDFSLVNAGGDVGITSKSQALPELTALTASPDAGDITTGHSVAFTLDLSAPVTVSGGTPDLILNDGGTAVYDAAASGGQDLVFDYSVQSGQSTDALAASSLDLNGASITGAGGAADLTNVGTSFPNLEVNVQTTATSPSIGGAGNTVTYTADGAAVAVDPKLSVSDTSATDLTGASVAISQGFLSGDTLDFANQNGISGSFDNTTGVLTLSGTTSLADYQTALDSVTFGSSATDPTASGADNTRTITWTANAATGSSQPVTSTIDIQSPSQPTPAKFEEVSGGGVFSQNGHNFTLDLGTLDAGANPLTIDLSVTNTSGSSGLQSGSFSISGDRNFSNSGFGSFSGVPAGQTDAAPTVILSADSVGTFAETVTLAPTTTNGSGSPSTLPAETLTITGSVEKLTIPSNGIIPLQPPGVSGADTTGGTLKITSGTGSFSSISKNNLTLDVSPGALLSGTVTLAADNLGPPSDVTPLIDTPSWGDPATSYQTINSSIPSGLSQQSASISLTAPTAPGTYHIIFAYEWEIGGSHVASATNFPLGYSVWTDGNDIAELNAAQVAQAQSLGYTTNTWLFINGYEPQFVPADAITVVVGGNTATLPPTIGGAGNMVTYTADGAAVAVDPNLSVSDTSATDLTGASVAISQGFLSGDTLDFANQNGISGSFDNAIGVLTLSGTASLADYQTALDSVTFSSTVTNPTASGSDDSRTITWAVTDANGTSSPATSTIDIQSPSQLAPALTALTASPDMGDIITGQSIAFTLDLSAVTTVSGGTPDLVLNDGGTAAYDAAASGATDLVFDDTVQSGQSTDTLAVSSLDLNGASVTGAGGSADLSNVTQSFPNLAVNATLPGGTIDFDGTIIAANSLTGSLHISAGGSLGDDGHNASLIVPVIFSGDGMISAASGTTLDLAGAVTGGGTLSLDGNVDMPDFSNSGDVFANGSADTIGALAKHIYVTTSPSTALTFLGDMGAATVFGQGGGLFEGGSGGDNVLVADGGNSTILGSTGGGDSLVGAQGNVMIAATPNDTVFAATNGGDDTVFGTASGSDVLVGGSGGAATLVGSTGNDAMWGGTGPDVLFGGTGNETLGGGTGNTTVVAGTGASTLVGGSGNQEFVGAASGQATAFSGIGDATLFTGGETMTVVLQNSTPAIDTIVLQSGNATIWAANGANPGTDVFDVIDGTAGGKDLVVGFKPGQDAVNLYGYQTGGAHFASASGGTALTLPDGTAITFIGLSASQVAESLHYG